jgi:hypothetical protein
MVESVVNGESDIGRLKSQGDIDKHPNILEAPRYVVTKLEYKYIPRFFGGYGPNIGWSAARAVSYLENPTIDLNEKVKLESDLKEKVGWGRELLKFLNSGGYSGEDFDKIIFNGEVLPTMNDFFKKKTGLEIGFLERIGTYFKDKKGYRSGWKFVDGSNRESIIDYIGMLASEEEDGEPTISDEVLLDFFESYNFVITQKSLEIGMAKPKIMSVFKTGIDLAIKKRIIPEIAKKRLISIDNEIDGFSFGDPIVWFISGNQAQTITMPNLDGEKKHYLEFFNYKEQLGHKPYHELLHVIHGDCLQKTFGGGNKAKAINEALTERLALSIFDDEHNDENGVALVRAIEKMNYGDNLNGSSYLKERKFLDQMLQKSPDGNRLYELLIELYFTNETDVIKKDLSAKQQEVFDLISSDIQVMLLL